MKSKSTAVLFAIILGGLGIHHFYLGDTKKGLCYLIPWVLFCWTLAIPIILWIIETIEGISLACKSQEEFDMKYNKGYYRTSYMPSTNYAPNYTNQAPKESQKSKTDQLFELKKLYDAGILTEEEFNVQKNKILNS